MSVTRILLFTSLLATVLFTLCHSGSRNNGGRESSSNEKRLLDILVGGAQEALVECRRQFVWERWYCPLSSFTDMLLDVPLTREQAFVYSITSAGIVQAITKNCSAGVLEDCICKPSQENVEEGFKYGGCSDDIDFPSRVARQFFEQRIDGQGIRTKVVLHNLQAGRVATRQSLERICKCHGSSGSCTTQTCWFELKGLGAIGLKLKKEYRNKAIMLEERKGTLVPVKNSRGKGKENNTRNINRNDSPKNKRPKERDLKPKIPQEDTDSSIIGINPRSLVYMEMSPEYCLDNATAGTLGTGGRTCAEVKLGTVLTKSQKKNCRHLCRGCGHRTRETNSLVTRPCKCEFLWCCNVHCETCTHEITKHFCVISSNRLLH